MNKFHLTARVRINGLNESKIHFVEQYLGEQIGSPWGTSDILEDDSGLVLDLRWTYDDSMTCEQDYECISERLSMLKRAEVIREFTTTTLVTERRTCVGRDS